MSDRDEDRVADTRMWGGRFEEATDALVQRFQSSVEIGRAHV